MKHVLVSEEKKLYRAMPILAHLPVLLAQNKKN